jgi:FKBP-type peptidyl-prolyl cis-trans isomerase
VCNVEGDELCRFYDVKIGEGPEVVNGDRVVVHYECKWRGITFVTSRQGVGVTGGEPYGFDVGATGSTKALKGVDLGVRGMQIGGVRKLILPSKLGYGDTGVSHFFLLPRLDEGGQPVILRRLLLIRQLFHW